MSVRCIYRDDSNYPATLSRYLGQHAPKNLAAIGNLDILHNKTLAVFSSAKCPGAIILKTYDLMKKLREADITAISGFHSAMERECLNILLKGKQPVIICPARSIGGMRIRSEYKKPLKEGRLLFLSPFPEEEKRISSEKALRRNYFVAALATSIFIPYAAPKSLTEMFCQEILKWGKQVYTIDDEKNKNLVAAGLKPVSTEIFLKNV
jgi:predicted Rossmann fold nucleotide-binding protein DprA/Smf involved in DNA uptake